MSLVEQRHAQRLRLLIGVPALAVAALASLTLLLMASPGLPTREAMFDLIMRLEPRPEADLPVATILIDEESSARVGPWPWPRSALAELVDAAEQAGALSVTLAVAVNGEDPLSPDVLAERWAAVPSTASQGAIDALEALPSNNLLLARAVAGGATSISVAGQVHGTSMAPRWAETTPQAAPWLATIAGEGAPERFSLPDTPTQAPLAPELGEARVLAVSGFPDDPGQIIRRAGVLYMANGEPAASAPLASVLASRGEKVSVTFRKNFLSFSGFMPKSVRVGEAPPI
ncbi:MAG: CHASE2 domain-containing protein, partial [Pseudomonadota bacterium]